MKTLPNRSALPKNWAMTRSGLPSITSVPYGRPSVPAIAGHALANTSRIRISTAVVVLPFQHPLRVAEDWATLDHLGRGRVDVGVGRGNQPREFAGFDLTLGEAEQRFSESLDIIRRAWTEERFSYDGEYWQFPELSVLPKPYTKPHPPLWQAAISDYTVKKIIDRGINGLIGPYLCPHEILKSQYFRCLAWNVKMKPDGQICKWPITNLSTWARVTRR